MAETVAPAPPEMEASKESPLEAITPVIAHIVDDLRTRGTDSFRRLNDASFASRGKAWEGDNRSFEKQNQEWNQGVQNWVEHAIQGDDSEAEKRKISLALVGLDMEREDMDMEKQVEAFAKKYVGENESKVDEFIADLSKDCTDSDYVVDLDKLTARVNSIEPLLKVFGTDKEVNILVKEYAISRGLLSQKNEHIPPILDKVQKMKKAPLWDHQKQLLDTVGIKYEGAQVPDDSDRDLPTGNGYKQRTEPAHEHTDNDLNDKPKVEKEESQEVQTEAVGETNSDDADKQPPLENPQKESVVDQNNYDEEYKAIKVDIDALYGDESSEDRYRFFISRINHDYSSDADAEKRRKYIAWANSEYKKQPPEKDAPERVTVDEAKHDEVVDTKQLTTGEPVADDKDIDQNLGDNEVGSNATASPSEDDGLDVALVEPEKINPSPLTRMFNSVTKFFGGHPQERPEKVNTEDKKPVGDNLVDAELVEDTPQKPPGEPVPDGQILDAEVVTDKPVLAAEPHVEDKEGGADSDQRAEQISNYNKESAAAKQKQPGTSRENQLAREQGQRDKEESTINNKESISRVAKATMEKALPQGWDFTTRNKNRGKVHITRKYLGDFLKEIEMIDGRRSSIKNQFKETPDDQEIILRVVKAKDSQPGTFDIEPM